MPVTTQSKVVDKSLTAKLATYKEQVKLYERRARFKLTEREQKIDEQLRIVITDRNIKQENLKKELHSVKMQLASTMNHNKSMVEEVTSLKNDFKQKENQYLEKILDMKALKEKVTSQGTAVNPSDQRTQSGQDNVVDDDVDEQPVQNLALTVDNVFQTEDCNAFDDALTAQTMFMANLSSADPVYDKAGPSYDLDVLSEYVKDNAVQVIQSDVSAIPTDAYMMMLYDMH
nr:hypothetical protein [Tanacetum cinerariifolium]